MNACVMKVLVPLLGVAVPGVAVAFLVLEPSGAFPDDRFVEDHGGHAERRVRPRWRISALVMHYYVRAFGDALIVAVHGMQSSRATGDRAVVG